MHCRKHLLHFSYAKITSYNYAVFVANYIARHSL